MSPTVFSVDGVLGKEAEFFLKHLVEHLAMKWGRSYGAVMSWVRTRLSFAILRVTMLCVRGSRTRWRSLGLVDGTSMFESL